MIQLNPIAKEIQKTLLEKMRMSGKTDTSISEPLSKTDGSAPSRNPDLSYLSQRTMWARMISLSLPKYVKYCILSSNHFLLISLSRVQSI